MVALDQTVDLLEGLEDLMSLQTEGAYWGVLPHPQGIIKDPTVGLAR